MRRILLAFLLCLASASGGAQGITGLPGGPWTSYTPTIGSTGGTLTSTTSTGRFTTIGKTVFLELAITVSNAGTASGGITVTLPLAPAANNYILAGRETQLTGKMLQGIIPTAAPMQVYNYDNTFPGATGNILLVSGVYEAQ